MVMEKELVFEGKKYISARRASEISGYNSDYLGQLCRSGKLVCKLVSRTWFVEENSILQHIKVSGRKKETRLVKAQKEILDPDKNIFFSDTQKIFLEGAKSEFLNDRFTSQKFFYKRLVGNVLLSLVVVASVTVIVFDTGNLLLKNRISFIENTETFIGSASAPVFERLSQGFEKIKESFVLKIDSVFSRFAGIKNKFAVNDLENKSDVRLLPDENGIVTIPISSGTDASAFSKIKNYLQDSFSDEVELIPDESGVAGVIKPVFTRPTDEEYLYVMVPVR